MRPVARGVLADGLMATLKLTSPPMEIWIGCSGWFYWHWKGLFYPEQCPTHRWFKHYASKFKTVELNAPFYRWPTPSTVKCWVKQAPKRGFTYCIKVNGLITHEKRFVGTKKLVRDFSAIADALGDRMGCFLFQMPPSYRYTPGRLRAIMSQLDHARPPSELVEFHGVGRLPQARHDLLLEQRPAHAGRTRDDG